MRKREKRKDDKIYRKNYLSKEKHKEVIIKPKNKFLLCYIGLSSIVEIYFLLYLIENMFWLQASI